MHLTVRRRENLPSFRQQRVGTLLLRLIHRLNDARFQIVHFSIQSNHIHLVVEAEDRAAITRKMRGFMIAFAKRLNAFVLGGRRGPVWADRYHRRDIDGPSDMHAVLRRVFGNAKEHGLVAADAEVLDPVPRLTGRDRWPRPIPRTQLLARDWIVRGLPSIRSPVGSAVPSGGSGGRSRAR